METTDATNRSVAGGTPKHRLHTEQSTLPPLQYAPRLLPPTSSPQQPFPVSYTGQSRKPHDICPLGCPSAAPVLPMSLQPHAWTRAAAVYTSGARPANPTISGAYDNLRCFTVEAIPGWRGRWMMPRLRGKKMHVRLRSRRRQMFGVNFLQVRSLRVC